MKAAQINASRFHPGFRLSVAVGAGLIALLLAAGVSANHQWSDTLGGVNLYAESWVAPQPSTTWWQGGGQSSSNQNITNIEITSVGWEYCTNQWYARWSEYDPRTNANLTDGYGWAYRFSGCATHCVDTDSSHYFHQSGSFGASPTTWQMACY